MSGHTPGPWEYRYNPKTRNTAIESVEGTGNIGLAHGGLDEDCRANARLIAAAPDLVEAADRARRFLKAYADATEQTGHPDSVGPALAAALVGVLDEALEKAGVEL